MKELTTEVEKFILKCFGFALLIAAGVFKACAISVLWGWFVVPTFSAPAFTIPVVLGVGLIISLFTSAVTRKENDVTVEYVLTCLLHPAVAIGFGYIFKAFM